MNPYFINEPAVISFSGGRSSAYMLYKHLEAHDGKLPEYAKAVFCNTGKEMEATLAFVRDCGEKWNVDIVWLEYTGKKSFKEVDYETASRNGEPFSQLITDKHYLPNMVARFCTSELKVLTIDRYMKSIGMEDFDTVIGIRADEPRRVAKMRGKENYLVPLADDGIGKLDIYKYWSDSDFDLKMPNDKGVNNSGNCDLCFLKGHSIKQAIIRENPSLADWWINQEDRIGARFRVDQPSYRDMKEYNDSQFNLLDDESIPCFCGE